MTIRPAAALLMIAFLSGCGSNCNILSGNQTAGCKVSTGATLLIAAPVLIPVAIIDNAKTSREAPRPVEKHSPKTERERELYRAAGAGAAAAAGGLSGVSARQHKTTLPP